MQKSAFSIKLLITDTPAEDIGPSLQTGKSADHAKMAQKEKGLGRGSVGFHIPIQACEKIESSDSAENLLPEGEIKNAN